MFNHKVVDMIEVVRYFASLFCPETYLELGLYKGETISYVKNFSKRCIGVDIKVPECVNGYEFYNMTTNVFFEKASKGEINVNGIDMAFIDADHSYLQSMLDFNNVFKYVNNNGLIFLHDTFPKNKEFTDSGYCGDTYKSVYDISKNDECEIITLPFHPGLSIIRKRRSHLLW